MKTVHAQPPITIGEAAARLGVSRDTLRRWTDDGKVPVVITPGGHRRYHVEDIDALLAVS